MSETNESTDPSCPQPVQMMPAHGTFCWVELASKDLAAAKSFYQDLFGWTAKASETTGMQYTEISAGKQPIGGMYQIQPEMGPMPTAWMAYVSVADVNATAARVTEIGGSVLMPPTDIPNVGRFAIIKDPTGGTLSIITLSPK